MEKYSVKTRLKKKTSMFALDFQVKIAFHKRRFSRLTILPFGIVMGE